MTRSLKSILPALGRILGASPNALYERQKTLTAEGLLKVVPGRGPGSGVHATPESIALLLIGTFSGLGITEVGPTARVLAEAGAQDGEKCPLTGAKNCRDALARILADQSLADRVDFFSVYFSSALGAVTIQYDSAGRSTVFIGPLPSKSAFAIDIRLKRDTVHSLAMVVSELLDKDGA
jgi:hypothetical protein